MSLASMLFKDKFNEQTCFQTVKTNITILRYIKKHIFAVCLGSQSSRKRRITRIGTHVFPLGRMIFARRESHVRMFFKSARAKNPVAAR